MRTVPQPDQLPLAPHRPAPRWPRPAALIHAFEASVVGQVLISLGLLVTLAAIVVTNMPDSQLKSDLLNLVAPYLNATGLSQDWGVFAPNPRMVSAYVEGRVEYANGTSSVWPIPAGLGFSAYSDYRWQKFEEQVRLDDNSRLWSPFAEYLANQARAAGRKPVRVSLVRRWAGTLPPGPGPERGPWQEYTFYVLPVDGAR
ncbi:MAG: hypothetical protein JO100_10350 [Pseudonocardia sp.]|nr:hypothetical protein [Pseudonocardia sp.]